MDRLEAEEEPEARSMSRRDMREKNGGDLLKSIVSRENMVRAYKQVRKNGGAPGVDGMTVDGLKTYLDEHYESLICSILDGTYRPLPVSVLSSCKEYLETKLKLKVNEKKSEAGSPLRLKFLGFSLCAMKKGQASIRIHEKSIDRFKNQIRELLRRNQGRSVEQVLVRLNLYTRGWLNYYSIADAKSFIQQMNKRIGRKIRAYIWKQWKRVKCRAENLQRLGIPRSVAWEWANTRLGIWRIAGSWVMNRSITNQQLENLGYEDILKRYNTLHSSC